MLGVAAARCGRRAWALGNLRDAFAVNAGAAGDSLARLMSDASGSLKTAEMVGSTDATGAASTSSTTTTFTLLDQRVEGPISIERKPVFAVVELAGSQYKVTPDDLIITEKLPGVDINDKIRLNKVLLLGNKVETIIGRPVVEGASVVAAVEEQFLDGKVLVFKKRRRKNSRRLNGHRQPLTSLRVIDIEGI